MTILGIDISKWHGNWDATKAKQAGATFVFIKASQATFTDPEFIANWQKAKDAGLLRGAYHYLDYTKPGVDQANYFADLLKNDPGELPPVIDYELRRTDNDPSAALGFLRDSLDQLTKRTELFEDTSVKRPMIYTGPGFWVEYGDQTKRDYWIQFPLWNAHWTTSSAPIIPSPWTMWQFWQFTSKGPGEAFGSEALVMDMNRFNGTLNELMEFAGTRIPVINLSELYDTLDEKVNNLEGVISSIAQTGDASTSGIFDRVDDLEGNISKLSESISTLATTLDQRVTTVEQKIANIGNTPSNPSTPISSSSDTTITSSPLETPIPTNPTPSEISYATCTTNALNVRSGPGATYPMVAGLKYGQRVEVINRQNGWAQLENPAGWSSEAYLSFEPSNSSAPAESTQPTTTVPAENPQPTTTVPAENPQPTTTVPAENPQPTTTPASYGICNTSGLNVRSGPGVTYPIVGGLTYGQRIKILNHKIGWAQVETPSGWCNESYLSFA